MTASVKTWLRLSMAVLLCALLLIYFVDVREVLRTLSSCDPYWTAIALGALTLDRVLMAYKWGLLLEIRGYRVTLTQRLMVYCSSMMWGLALPSTVGADGIRVVLVRRFGVRVDDALATILVERGLGFVSALLTAVIALLILRAVLPDTSIYDLALLGGVVALLVAIGVLIFSFSSDAAASFLRILPRRLAESRVAQLLLRLHDAYCSLAVDKKRLAVFLVLTFIEQILMAACYAAVAMALLLSFDAIFIFAAVPLAILVSRLPISIDGLGVYEGIFMAIMTFAGLSPDDSLAVSLATRVFQVVVWFPWWLMLAVRMGGVRPPVQQSHAAAASVKESY